MSFSKERMASENGSHWDYWIPMVSFCDIPLHLISDHIDEYGHYGLGLSRKWAINCKLNPVFYYQEKSILFDEFSSMMALQHEDFTSMSNQEMLVKSVRDTYLKSRYIMQFYKPWYGYDFKINKEKSFYDEREWRYIPIQENGYESIYNDSEEFHARREEYYERLLNPVLIFEPRDITYIVLENESERYELIMQIRRIKERYSFRDVETLVSRIITAEQISSDI